MNVSGYLGTDLGQFSAIMRRNTFALDRGKILIIHLFIVLYRKHYALFSSDHRM